MHVVGESIVDHRVEVQHVSRLRSVLVAEQEGLHRFEPGVSQEHENRDLLLVDFAEVLF